MRWLHREVILAIHDEQLAEHGGDPGIRDSAALDSTLARPRNILSYRGERDASVPELAAAYAFSFQRNHAFVDGNKRVGFVAMETFLLLNGFELVATDFDCVATMVSVAAGTMSEMQLVEWVRDHARPVGS